MKLDRVNDYIKEKQSAGLTKIDVSFELDEEMQDDYYITKTKETYVFADESQADELIDTMRQDPGFEAASKKFKEGKVSKKTGDQLSPDTYTVVIKLNH